ncbi:MAG: hypothetical protein CVT63_02740 [Candidatus Anoxymicrobium japonicum]|uniref:Uncharacterized protein n=1 Tax=Candidatus Anoxymicrobium japonicum TaxID=2013648 RepID=A0A2N3G778_9ACTN|nr:MAG: hypothetical protein CVT63_02740 [Candidatus Anoxymicrobium japonicum]
MDRDPEKTLKDLVERAKGGDRVAYGSIFRICFKEIYDYTFRRVGDVNATEDITMQVFAQGLKSIGAYEERGISVKAWLFKIAHNAIIDFLRHKKYPAEELNVDFEERELPGKESDEDIEASIILMESMENLHREIAGLPVAQREVLVLRFIEDMSVTETAVILGKKESTVRALQFKGIKNLKRKLVGAGEDAERGSLEDGSRAGQTKDSG